MIVLECYISKKKKVRFFPRMICSTVDILR